MYLTVSRDLLLSCSACSCVDLVADWVVTASPNGWSDNEKSLWWLKHIFDAQTAHLGVRLLLVDGHESHVQWRFVQYCLEHDILLVCMPAHTSNLMQPLDRGLFSPLAHWYTQQVSDCNLRGRSLISKEYFLELLAAAWAEAFHPRNIKGGWKATGINPYDPARALDGYYARPVSPSRARQFEPDRPITPENVSEFDTALGRLIERHQPTPKSLRILTGMSTFAKKASASKRLALDRVRTLELESRHRHKRKRRIATDKGAFLTGKEAKEHVWKAQKDELTEARTRRRQIALKEALEHAQRYGKMLGRKRYTQKRLLTLYTKQQHQEVETESETSESDSELA